MTFDPTAFSADQVGEGFSDARLSQLLRCTAESYGFVNTVLLILMVRKMREPILAPFKEMFSKKS